MDGWTICERLREKRNATPILMLTARDNVRDKVRGLEIGADDYLSKPFNFGELLARVNALIRRDRMHKTKVIIIGDLSIDPGARRVERAGKEISLTEREFTLLEALASHEGQVLTREAIQERVWLDEDSYSNTVDVYIGTLRKKIDAGFDEKLIKTVHGVGYTLRRAAE
jgi:DNA-binding response OmpR family regulator